MMIGSMVGNYKIVRKIGEGGMGSVFQGIDIMLEREVAIKMLRPEFASQPNVVERFRTEAVTLAKLSHPNIATLHSFFRQRDDFFMVMEFVRGETLDDVIRRRGAMTLGHALPLFCQSLEGIGHAHRMGIIHRDIKPANMMLTPEGSIKVMDFGIARVLGTARMTRHGAIVGTIEYMSPEQVRGEEGDARSDVYSLGILLYEMLTGRLPFSSTSEFELMRAQTDDAPTPPRAFVAEIPLQVEQSIMRSLAKRVEARFQTAGEFSAALLNGTPAAANVLANPVAIPAPSPPRVNQTSDLASMHAEVVKETRLGAYPARSSATDNQIRETRLAQVGGVQHVYAQSAADYVQSATQALQPESTSLLSQLNWKHYTGAAFVLLVLIGGLLWLAGVGNRQIPQRLDGIGLSEPEPTEAISAPPAATEATGTQEQTPSSETAPEPASKSTSPGQPESGVEYFSESSTGKRTERGRGKADAAQRERARKRKATEDALNK